MRARLAALVLATLAAVSSTSLAQSSNRLTGTWERFSLKDTVGTATQPPTPAAFLLFTADGHYAQLAMPRNRPKVTKPLAEMTKEELLARFSLTEARWGKYTVAGDSLSRTYEQSVNPNNEGGGAQVQKFRIEGDVLSLTSFRPGILSEAKFRRVK